MNGSTAVHGATRPYLLIKHTTGWNVDRCTLWMADSGLPHLWCYPAAGDEFPHPADHAGVIVFGGAPSANDCSEHDWVRRELEFIESCLASDIPFFGICLGAQMLARVLGARIDCHPEGAEEIGFFPVEPTPAGSDFMPEPLTVMQWHREGFSLPAGATLLASSALFPHQAYRMAPHVVGVQFHPEVNPAALEIWHERNRLSRPEQLDDRRRAQMMSDAHRYDATISTWLDRFLTAWTRVCARAA